ncbi:hypothetical protein [Solibacillus sp. CAU 1738]|uniref:phage neck terminator protein n=1 Tax=Solibacillus sp. CAU 1738 TaxID=3140363 RepID=UPI003260CE0F
MNLIKAIRTKIATDERLTVIRADQTGELPDLPYATYKVISDKKGAGRENVEHIDQTDALIEQRSQERNATISFNVYGTSHDNACEQAKQLRKWFEWRGSLFLDELNVAIIPVSEVKNRTTFLIDSYDEKWGFDVIIRYNDSDQYEIDYFDKVEINVEIEKE